MAKRKKKSESSLGGFILLFLIGWGIVKCSSNDPKDPPTKPMPMTEIPHQTTSPTQPQLTAAQQEAMEKSEAEAYAKIKAFAHQHGISTVEPPPVNTPKYTNPSEQRQQAELKRIQTERNRIKAEERAWHQKWGNAQPPTTSTSSYSSNSTYHHDGGYSNCGIGQHYVHSYTRKDGTTVSGHCRQNH